MESVIQIRHLLRSLSGFAPLALLILLTVLSAEANSSLPVPNPFDIKGKRSSYATDDCGTFCNPGSNIIKGNGFCYHEDEENDVGYYGCIHYDGYGGSPYLTPLLLQDLKDEEWEDLPNFCQGICIAIPQCYYGVCPTPIRKRQRLRSQHDTSKEYGTKVRVNIPTFRDRCLDLCLGLVRNESESFTSYQNLVDHGGLSLKKQVNTEGYQNLSFVPINSTRLTGRLVPGQAGPINKLLQLLFDHGIELSELDYNRSPPVVLKLAVFGICFGFLLYAVSGVYYSVKKHKSTNLKYNYFKKNGGLWLEQHISSNSRGRTKNFTADELEMATDHYDESHIFCPRPGPGEIGTGLVYKGRLLDGVMVAIKKKVVAEDEIEPFINGIINLTKINHQNVVKFLGCCLEIESPMLVYELACNGTLFDYIHRTNGRGLLPWHILLKIASESAAALAYLHSAADSSKPMIIHGNVKSSNILLTDCFMAKVSGFEPSRSVPINESQISTLVQRTLGYLDPEYLRTGQLTDKSDVYSFGVVLLEILTGEMPICFDRPENRRIITSHFVLSMERNGLFLQIVAPQLVTEGNKEQIRAVAELAKSCLKLSGLERPTMEEVAGELKRLCGTYST